MSKKPSERRIEYVELDALKPALRNPKAHALLDDGETLLVECSLALLNSISVAFHARDEVEGKPSSR